jgi:uncharacterized protein
MNAGTALGLPMAMALGLLFGLGPCLVSCLSYLAPVFLGVGGGMRRAWQLLLPLALGRLTAYLALGTLSGALGQWLADGIAGNTGSLLLGCATVMIGGALLLRSLASATNVCGHATNSVQPLQRATPLPPRPLLPGGLYLLGLAVAVNPCAPLGLVLGAAAASGNALHGAALGLAFGSGAVAVPTLIYATGFAYCSERLREQLGRWRPRVERLGAVLLILVGLRQLAGLV